ncbi:MAG: DegV family protein [Anaerolineales bacterium]|jgi:DegV family protein with EDD domain
MSKIAIVTDSTAYIPPDLVEKYNLTITPQVLIWGEETYQDGVDIQPNEFYERLKTTKVMPTTSQVSIATMKSTFESLIEQGYDVLGIFLSAKLSGTIQSAIQAKDMLDKAGEKVTFVDSLSTAMAMGFQVLTVARAVEDGASLEDAIALAEKARKHTGVYFAVDTLEFLHRGGRIGGAQRFLGTALNMKPVLAVQDGRVEAVERIRTKSKALERVLELVVEKTQGKSPIRLATLHASAEKEAKELLEKASKKLNATESILTTVSPVVGTHAGPGTVGLAYMAGM